MIIYYYYDYYYYYYYYYYYKDATLEKRRKERGLQWNELFDLCNCNDKEYINKYYQKPEKLMDLPIPPLSFTLYYKVLEDLNLDIIKCPGEADQVIAIACSLNNKNYAIGSEKYFCVGNDRLLLLLLFLLLLLLFFVMLIMLLLLLLLC